MHPPAPASLPISEWTASPTSVVSFYFDRVRLLLTVSQAVTADIQTGQWHSAVYGSGCQVQVAVAFPRVLPR